MQIELAQALKSESHQRTADRQGYANGFKPNTLRTRVGEVPLRIPQTRDYHYEQGLGCSSEAETHRRAFLESLQAGGMHGVKFVVSDDHSGHKAARQVTMPGVHWQRWQFHTIQNALAHVPKASMNAGVAEDVRCIFNLDDAAEADRRLKATVAR